MESKWLACKLAATAKYIDRYKGADTRCNISCNGLVRARTTQFVARIVSELENDSTLGTLRGTSCKGAHTLQ